MNKYIDEKTWKAAIYVRLSKEDGDKEESDSISNQKDLIREYVKSMPDITIISEMVDDGYSGGDFNRPAFINMMDNIKAGLINCVIVKDLSRFGRNWIESGKYIEKIFPFMKVRFISVNDSYDSINQKQTSDNIIIPFKNLINDAYLRDISVKVRSQLEIKRKKGDFIGSFAVFGYMKDKRNHNKLVIDEYAAEIVKDVFKWKIDGMSQQSIANRLNNIGILSPLEYKKETGINYSTSFKVKQKALWSAVAVGRILKNEIYLGVLEQGKVTTSNYKVKNRIVKSKEEWVRYENAHEPIISVNDFKIVNQLLKQDLRIAPTEETVYIFSGILICADCKQNMIRKTIPSGKKKYIYYVCTSNKNKKTCSSHSISEYELENAVKSTINSHIESIISIDKMIKFIESLPLKQLDVQKLDKQIKVKEIEMEKYNNRIIKLYEDLTDKIITKEEYISFKSTFTKLYNETGQTILKLKSEMSDILNNKTVKNLWIENFKKYHNINKLTRKVILTLIDKIYVYENGRINICFKYQDEYENAVNFIELVNKITPLENYNAVKEAM